MFRNLSVGFVLNFILWGVLLFLLGWYALIVGWGILYFFFDLYLPPMVTANLRLFIGLLLGSMSVFIIGGLMLLHRKRQRRLDLSSSEAASVGETMHAKNVLYGQKFTQMALFKQPQEREHEAVVRLSSAMKSVNDGQWANAVSQFRTILSLPETPDVIRAIALQKLSESLEELLQQNSFSSMGGGRR